MENIIESILTNNIKEYKLTILAVKPSDKNVFTIGSVIISTLLNTNFRSKGILTMVLVWLKWHWNIDKNKKLSVWNKLLKIIQIYKHNKRNNIINSIFKNIKMISTFNECKSEIRKVSGVKFKLLLSHEKSFFDNQFIEKLKLQRDCDIVPCNVEGLINLSPKKLSNNSLNTKKNYNFSIDNWKSIHSEEIELRLINFMKTFKLRFIREILKFELIKNTDYNIMSYEEKCNYYIRLSDSFKSITSKIKVLNNSINDCVIYLNNLIFDEKSDRRKNSMLINSLLKSNDLLDDTSDECSDRDNDKDNDKDKNTDKNTNKNNDEDNNKDNDKDKDIDTDTDMDKNTDKDTDKDTDTDMNKNTNKDTDKDTDKDIDKEDEDEKLINMLTRQEQPRCNNEDIVKYYNKSF